MQSRIIGTTMPVLEFLLDPTTPSSPRPASSPGCRSIQMTTHTQFGGRRWILRRLQTRGRRRQPFHDRVPCLRQRRARWPSPRACPAISFRSRCARAMITWFIATAFSALRRRSSSASASSSRSAPASSAATASCCRRSRRQGTAWLELSGEVIVKDLAPGETLRVHPGHVGAFQTRSPFRSPCARPQEHDLRRRRHLSRRAHRPGTGVAPDTAHLPAGPSAAANTCPAPAANKPWKEA